MKLIGNANIMEQLNIASKSCKSNDKPLPHMLLSGAAGCGKTSTAKYLASITGTQFFSIVPETIKTRDDVLNVLDQFDKIKGYDWFGNRIKEIPIAYPILFIDEIHRLPISGQETLGIAMEEWRIPVDPKQTVTNAFDMFGIKATNRSRWCPMFTLIGATTNDGLLSKPFKDRCKFRFVFNTYSIEDSIEIVKVHVARLCEEGLNIKVDAGGANEIAKRGRGVPRIIVGLLERCRDMAVASNREVITADVARVAFGMLGIDSNGLTSTDIKILKYLFKATEPIGLDNMSILTNESKQVISDTIEPYLIQQELITRTGRGRTLTDKGREYLITNGHIEAHRGWVDIPHDYVRRL